MKVIDGDPHWTMQVTCNACKRVLEIEQADLQVKRADGDLDVYIVCPVCHTYHIFNGLTANIPSGIWNSVIDHFHQAGG